MTDPLALPVVIFGALQDGATLVTANQRQVRHIQLGYAQFRQQRGHSVWESPDVLSWSAWLERCWHGCSGSDDYRQLLSADQELAVWESVVKAALSPDQALMQPVALARSAREGWQRMQDWGLGLPFADVLLDDESRSFQDWSQAFSGLCQKHRWIPMANLAAAVQRAFRNGILPVPDRLLIYGFEEMTLAQKRLLDTVSAGKPDGHVQQLPLASADQQQPTRGSLRCCADANAEIAAAAHWARRHLLAEAQCQLAIVVPDLEQRRERLVNVLTEVLNPESALPSHGNAVAAFNISLGPKLAEYPLIRSAMLLLSLATEQRLSLNDAGRLLRSPYLAGSEMESGSRALLDKRIRERGSPTISLGSLQAYASNADRPWHCPRLVAALDTLGARAFAMRNNKRSPADWAEEVWKLLHKAGWCAGRTLDSDEYQTVQAWQNCMVNAGQLGMVAAVLKDRNMSLSAFVGRLRSLAANTPYQPRTSASGLQVLGVMEAVGLSFDHIWVMGLHDEAWPPVATPHPLIPLKLQRDHQLPHATAARELRYAQGLMTHLAASLLPGGQLIYSYPQNEGERDLRPSPLIAGLPRADEAGLETADAHPLRRAIQQSHALQAIVHDDAPPLPPQQSARGGSSLFKQQSACPFSAFAVQRLAARPLEQVDIGLDAAQRGELAHEVMAAVWKRLGSQAGLLEHDEVSLSTLVGQVIESVMEQQAEHNKDVYQPRFTRIEHRRLQNLALQWLALEAGRKEGFQVEAVEQRRELEVSGLGFNVTIDRIDRLDSGEHVVIDYKTGKVSVGDWAGQRPNDPQLPLYGVFGADEVEAIVFGQLRAGELAFKGIASDAHWIKGVSSVEKSRTFKELGDWQTLHEHWRAELTALAEGFRAGNATVDPKSEARSCQYCDLTSLCRIAQRGGMAADVSDDGETL